MKKYKLLKITDSLSDVTVQSPNGTRYVVQIFFARAGRKYEALIQQIGRPEYRPLQDWYETCTEAVEALNRVLRRIGVELEL